MSSSSTSTSLHFVTADPTADDAASSARAILSQVDALLGELRESGAATSVHGKSIVAFIRDIPGCDYADDEPNKLPHTALRRAIQREPPLHERKPLQFEPLSAAQLEAAFALEVGALTSEQMLDIEQTREADKARKRAEKQAKKERKRAKHDATAAAAAPPKTTTNN